MHHHPQNQERALNLSILTVSGIFCPVERTFYLSSFGIRAYSREHGFPMGLARTLSQPKKTDPPLCVRCDGLTLLRLATGLASACRRVGVPCSSWCRTESTCLFSTLHARKWGLPHVDMDSALADRPLFQAQTM